MIQNNLLVWILIHTFSLQVLDWFDSPQLIDQCAQEAERGGFDQSWRLIQYGFIGAFSNDLQDLMFAKLIIILGLSCLLQKLDSNLSSTNDLVPTSVNSNLSIDSAYEALTCSYIFLAFTAQFVTHNFTHSWFGLAPIPQDWGLTRSSSVCLVVLIVTSYLKGWVI